MNNRIRDFFYNLYVIKTLSTIDPVNVGWLSLEGDVIPARVIDVYDGDTITIIFNFQRTFFKEKCRLENIDTAEIRTRNEEEKKFALETKEYLSNLILNKIIYVKCGKWDKFGRLLGTIYSNKDDLVQNRSINNLLIQNGMAYEYTGKTKEDFNNWKM